MIKKQANKDEKEHELLKYRNLILATIDYPNGIHYSSKSLKLETEEHYKKGRLTILKRWFRDLTEMYIENKDLKFNKFLQEKTNTDIDIFKSYFDRIDKIIKNGKIISDNQFYDIGIFVNELCQTEPIDENKIQILNSMLIKYEQRKRKNIKNNA